MANCHIGHNSRLGDHIIIANGVLLGGYVLVQDRAFLSGTASSISSAASARWR